MSIQFGNTIDHWHFINSLFEYDDELPHDLVSVCLNNCQLAYVEYERIFVSGTLFVEQFSYMNRTKLF